MTGDAPQRPADIRPTDINVYGYCVIYRDGPASEWRVDRDDEYLHIPAHYMFVQEALGRVDWLRDRGLHARVGALLAEKTDTPSEFERNRINESETNPD